MPELHKLMPALGVLQDRGLAKGSNQQGRGIDATPIGNVE
jgi:hypothetical protein